LVGDPKNYTTPALTLFSETNANGESTQYLDDTAYIMGSYKSFILNGEKGRLCVFLFSLFFSEPGKNQNHTG